MGSLVVGIGSSYKWCEKEEGEGGKRRNIQRNGRRFMEKGRRPKENAAAAEGRSNRKGAISELTRVLGRRQKKKENRKGRELWSIEKKRKGIGGNQGGGCAIQSQMACVTRRGTMSRVGGGGARLVRKFL